MTKKYTNQDIWNMGAENTANLLNKLTKENQKLKDDKHQHFLDMLSCNPIFRTPTPIGLPYDNIYYRTSRQLEEHLEDNGFPVDNVSRSSVGRAEYYNVQFNLSNDEWSYTKTSQSKIASLLGIKGVGLVDFHKENEMVHEVILIDEKELNRKYLKDGNLVFE